MLMNSVCNDRQTASMIQTKLFPTHPELHSCSPSADDAITPGTAPPEDDAGAARDGQPVARGAVAQPDAIGAVVPAACAGGALRHAAVRAQVEPGQLLRR